MTPAGFRRPIRARTPAPRTRPIDDANFELATPLAAPSRPLTAGNPEQFEDVGVSPATPYFFAVRAIANVGNRGGASNAAQGTTDP